MKIIESIVKILDCLVKTTLGSLFGTADVNLLIMSFMLDLLLFLSEVYYIVN